MKKLALISGIVLAGCGGQFDKVCGGIHTAADAHSLIMKSSYEYCKDQPNDAYCASIFKTGVHLNAAMEVCYED